MIIQNIYDLNIYIDNLNIFNAPGCILMEAEIYEAINVPLPSCILKLNVPIGWIDDRSIVDGTLIRFTIDAPQLNISEDIKFRLFNLDILEVTQNFCQIELKGIIDIFAGYQNANHLNMYGSSSDLFKQICKYLGITYDIDNTNDEQLWVAGENNIFQFISKTARFGWVDELSGMFWCIDRDKRLIYKNLTTLFRNRSNKIGTFIQNIYPDINKNQFSYSKATASMQSGFENIINGGYGGNDKYFDILTYDWKSVSAKKVVAESKILNINKDLSKGLADQWYPFDIGNFHKNYWLAQKQNSRILSTYSSYVTLVTQMFMNYHIGQIVNYEYIDAQDINNKVKMLSGTFMIDAIKIKISLKAITSILEIVTQGINGTALTQETY